VRDLIRFVLSSFRVFVIDPFLIGWDCDPARNRIPECFPIRHPGY